MEMKKAVILLLVLSAGCKRSGVYTDDLQNPKIVLDNYIRALAHGDTNRVLYYTSGNWEEVKKLGPLGSILDSRSQQKARDRWFEHYSWIIEEVSLTNEKIKYKVLFSSPDYGYILERLSSLKGDIIKPGEYKMGNNMSDEEALKIIRQEKNLPITNGD